MEEILDNLLENLQENAPEMVKTFQYGASHQEILAFERHFKVKFPSQVKDFFSKINGQDIQDGYTFIEGQHFIALNDVPYWQDSFIEALKEINFDWEKYHFSDEDFEDSVDKEVFSFIKNQIFSYKWIPFLVSENSFYFIDFEPEKQGSVGQIGAIFILEGGMVSVDFIADSLEDFLSEISIGLEQGFYIYSKADKCLVDNDLDFDIS